MEKFQSESPILLESLILIQSIILLLNCTLGYQAWIKEIKYLGNWKKIKNEFFFS